MTPVGEQASLGHPWRLGLCEEEKERGAGVVRKGGVLGVDLVEGRRCAGGG